MRPGLVYIISDINKALSFEWIVVRLVDKFQLYVILIGNEGTQLEYFLRERKISVILITDKEYPGYGKKIIRLIRHLRQIRPYVVHTHLWRATLLGISASWILRINKRVFTRHHAMVHYDEHPSGRKWDILCNFLATDIIAISENIKRILIDFDKASPDKIRMLHHGFDISYFRDVSSERAAKLREKHLLPPSINPVIGVIARYTEWKGIQFIITAFVSVVNKYPHAHLILANANGPYRETIQALLKQLPSSSYTEISFEPDLAAMYKLFDVYVHVPVNEHAEAFGQTYVESLLCGIPSVFTLSGIAKEFVVDGVHGLTVPFRNSEAIADRILEILENEDVRMNLISREQEVAKLFGIDEHILNLTLIYDTL